MKDRILELLNRRFYTDDDISALGPEAVPHVIALFEEVREPGSRRALVYMAGVLDGDEAVEFLAEQYRRSAGVDESLHVAVTVALARTDHEKALALILPLLASAGKRLRKNALVGLRWSRRPEVLSELKACADSDPDEELRRIARKSAAQVEERLSPEGEE